MLSSVRGKEEMISSGWLSPLTNQFERLPVIVIFCLLHLTSQLSCTDLISPPPPSPTATPEEDRFAFHSDVRHALR